MFDKDLVEIVLKKKRDEYRNLQPNNTADADRLLKEIKYLKNVLVRYRIAALLKLDSDSYYAAHDYLGIEEEDVTQFNLSPAELGEYNHLVSMLPAEQLQRFKIRKQMADIVGEEISSKFEDNYVGIENIDPTLTKYGLTKEQIKDFQDLITDINHIAQDTTKSVDLKKEAMELLEDAYKNLNINDMNKYNNIKDSYLSTIDNLLKYIDEDSKKKFFSGGVSNYELAKTLAEKYPELNIKMDINGVKKLLKMLENSNLDEDKYNDYMKFLHISVNELYADDSNKTDIENLFNSISRSNLLFRHDLLPITSGINNVDLSIQDSELENLFNFLDANYDTLDETERNKYCSLLENKMDYDLNDLDKLKRVNKLLLSVKNKNFEERLQNKFSSNKHAEFKNQHLNSYQLLVQDEIRKLEALKAKYISRKPKTGFMSTYYATKEAEIDKEIEKLRQIKESYEDSSTLGVLNSAYNKGTEKVNSLEKEIADLRKLKEQVKSKFHSRLIDRKIENRNKKIARLRKLQGRIVGTQKIIMAPRLFIERKRGMIDRHFETKQEVFQNYANDYQQLANAERSMNGMFSELKAAFYEFKAGRYESKAKFNQKICNVLNGGTVTVRGNNQRMINRNTLNNIRQNQQQQVQVQIP